MEAVDTSSRQSNTLPSINHFDPASIKREDSDSHKKSDSQSSATMPGTPYSPAFQRPPPPPNYQPSQPSYGPTALSGLISPPESRRMSGDEQEQNKSSRQSLPSIHEALNSESRFPQPPTQPAPTSAPISAPPPYQQHPPTPSSEPSHRQFAPDLPNPGPPYPAPSAQSTYPSAVPTTPATAPPGPPDSLPRPSFPSGNSKLPALHPLRTMQSPVDASRPSYPYPQQSSAPEPSPLSASHPPPYGYASVRPSASYAYPAQGRQHQPNPAYPPTSAYPGPARYGSSYRTDELHHVEESKRNGKFPGALHYGESVQRHLEQFDMEASLIETEDFGNAVVAFAKTHRNPSLPPRRPTPMSFPPPAEIKILIKRNAHFADSLQRMYEVSMQQQETAANLEKTQEQQRYQTSNGYEDPSQHGYHNEQKGGNDFNGPDPKKRRGRAAPPGRCHSCNRAETPEWRRGPDGARTLCNACGLHYAKLTRKMGNNKAAVGNSNLRPKSLGPGSPAA